MMSEDITGGPESIIRSRSSTPPLSSLADDAPHAKILRLLRVLYQLNTLEAEGSLFSVKSATYRRLRL